MRRSWSIITGCVLCLSGGAQNLVPNGGFEDYSLCPTYFGQTFLCAGWLNLYTQSADYFNACHTDGVVGVPLNQFGNQFPAQGDGYMGMATYQYNQQEYREVVGIQVTEPLQVGVPVCLAFKMAVGGFGTSAGASAGYTCKGVGMKFFMAPPTEQYIYDYPNSAALYLDEVPTDTATWYEVAGTYVPDSAYTYVVIGNFFADSLSQPTLQDSIGFGATDWAYAFIDDVRASFALDYCTLDLSSASLLEQAPLVYPIPAVNELHIRLPGQAQELVRYSLRDPRGQDLHTGSLAPGSVETSIPLEALPSGMYWLQLTTTRGSWSPIPVVHVSP